MSARSIAAILRAEGPCLSNRVCALLEADGLTSVNARKRVSRGEPGVQRLDGLSFPSGVRFLFLPDQLGSRKYWEALVRDIAVASPAYSAALGALLARGGVVPEKHFSIVCGAPINQKGQISASLVLERLKEAEIVHVTEVPGIGPCVTLRDVFFLSPGDDAALRARLRTEAILLSAVKDWARRLGAASYDRIETRDDQEADALPKVGTFTWDLAGPSYLRPMVRRSSDGKPKPGFLVADVALGQTLNEAAVAAFVRKCTLLGSLGRIAPVWPILIGDRFSREAHRLGRSAGVMMATPELLFGQEVAEGLSSLLHTLAKAAAIAVQKPEVIDTLFRSLGKIEGAAINLRGDLFEMIVGHLVVKLEDGSIDIGRKILDPESGRPVEIDVLRVKEGREVWSYECKGRSPSNVVTLAEIETWLTEKVPRMHRWVQWQDRFQGVAFHAEFWTTGTFSPEALARLESAREATQRYRIGWKDGAEVRRYATRLRPTSVLDMLDKHFFNHPIARTERRFDAPDATKAFAVPSTLGDLLEPPSRRKLKPADAAASSVVLQIAGPSPAGDV